MQLDQNRPNPFNGQTSIRFGVARRGNAELVIYNLAGQRVATLLQAYREAGDYAVIWDGRGDDGVALASGVYVYRLQSGSQVMARKLLLLR